MRSRLSIIRRSYIAIFSLLFLAPSLVAGQQVFDQKTTDVGNLGLTISNVGTIGRPDVRNNPAGPPSMEYPLNSGTEHLFEAGIWIGASRGGSQQLVSTAAVTNPSGYSTGKAGFEFTNDGTPLVERSSLSDSPLYSPLAVSHQDYVGDFSDKRVAIETPTASVPINGHDQPLYADVHMESYNWNFSFTESFSIIRYDITNGGDAAWDSVYVGMYGDLVVRNINTTLEQGSDFFNKNGLGYLDSLYTTYVFDAGSSDQPSINTYGALSVIGSEYRGELYHPSNAQYLRSQGKRVPQVGPSYWLFNSGAGNFRAPSDDVDRYSRMASEFPLTPDIREKLRTDGQDAAGNYISMISIGPFPEVEPGETVTVYFAFSAARKPEAFQGLAGKPVDTPESRELLVDNLDWLYRTFRGEDKNNNGKLDSGEDINNNGELDRYLIPEPPNTPNMKVQLEAGKVTLYWDRRAERSVDPVTGEHDFEGYRIYRSRLGDDLKGTISQDAQVIAEFDSTGNDVGFNSGFEPVELDEPVTFGDDTTKYWYKFEVSGLLSGWQYLFSVTAFDGGSKSVDISSLESNVNANAVRVFPGTGVNENFGSDKEEYQVGVYPNPYRVNAAWDGSTSLNRKLMFYNLPQRAEIRVYTLAGEVVAELEHDAASYSGDIRWYNDFSTDQRLLAGGEHAWDLLSEANQNLTTGLYLYSVKDLDSGKVQTGKLAIIK